MRCVAAMAALSLRRPLTAMCGSIAMKTRSMRRASRGRENPLRGPGCESEVKLLAGIDAYVRDKDPRVRQVTVSLGATWQVVEILRPDGGSYRRIPPLAGGNIFLSRSAGDRQESGSKGYGGREGYARF